MIDEPYTFWLGSEAEKAAVEEAERQQALIDQAMADRFEMLYLEEDIDE